jgi:cytochrome c2
VTLKQVWSYTLRLFSFPAQRRLRMIGLLLIFIVLGYGAAFAVGFLIGHREYWPYRILARIDAKLTRLITADDAPLPPRTIISHLAELDLEAARVERLGRAKDHPVNGAVGGGLAEFGGTALLLAHNGAIYAASGPGDLRRTGLVAPDNGRGALELFAASSEAATLNVTPSLLRYNGLERFATAAAHGLLASYTEFHPQRLCITNTLARMDFPPDATIIEDVVAAQPSWRILHRTVPCLPLKRTFEAVDGNLAGGRLAFHPPSTVYWSSGDLHFDGMRSAPGDIIAQDPSAEYGKILAVDVETGAATILAMGSRNAQGLLATESGDMLFVEHGPRGGDELNKLRRGANYGWPLESYGTAYQTNDMLPAATSFGRHDEFEKPMFAFVPSIAPSSLIQIRDPRSEWRGDLVIGSLAGESLFRIRLEGERVMYTERIPLGFRVRDIVELADGRLVLWTDQRDLVFVTARPNRRVFDADAWIAARGEWSDIRKSRVSTAFGRCVECHSTVAGDDAKAPSFAGLEIPCVGARPAERSVGDASCSDGDAATAWLAAYLRDPERYAPGTTMATNAIEDQGLATDLARLLVAIRGAR